ncbi:MAG: glycosyltransferase family 9 protein [Solitalea-like symbiont of Tyrophagus putrescentiae]
MIKVLVIRFSSIGDIVWTSPFIRCLKNKFKDNIEIHYLTKRQYKCLVEGNIYINKIHLLEDHKNLFQLIKYLKKENFNYIIDLHNKLRSIIVRLLLLKTTYKVKKNSLGRYLFVKFKTKVFLDQTHFVDKFIRTAKPLGIKNDGKGIDYFIPENTKLHDIKFDKYAVYIMSASTFNKKLNLNKAIELCSKIKYNIVLIGGLSEVALSEQLQLQFPNKIQNMVNILSINESAAIIKNASEVFGHDTGLTQIASAFHNTIYSIWGSTSPNGVYPYCKTPILIENLLLKCRPCSKSGLNYCPKGHFKCINDLKINI